MPQAVNSEAPTFPDQEMGVRKNQNGQGETITCSEDYILKKVQIVLIKPSVMYFCCMQNYMQVPVFRQGTVCINPFTLRAPPESNVCYFHTFENNLRTKRKLTKSLKESCSLASDRQFSFICFPENAFVSNIFPNLTGLFWLV